MTDSLKLIALRDAKHAMLVLIAKNVLKLIILNAFNASALIISTPT